MLTEKDIVTNPDGNYADKFLFIKTPLGLIKIVAIDENFQAQFVFAKMVVDVLNLLELKRKVA